MDGRTSQTHKKTAVLILLACAVVLAAFGCLMVGSSGMTVSACLDALLGRTGGTAARIIWGIRIPRLLAALIAGAGLSVSGLLMQTSLGNAMASPSTLGVSHAAVFGANHQRLPAHPRLHPDRRNAHGRQKDLSGQPDGRGPHVPEHPPV